MPAAVERLGSRNGWTNEMGKRHGDVMPASKEYTDILICTIASSWHTYDYVKQSFLFVSFEDTSHVLYDLTVP